MISGIQAAKALGKRGPFILAEACGVSRMTIYNWEKIPAEMILTVEKATGIDRGKLRPDLKALWTKRTAKPRKGNKGLEHRPE
ncbi:MAG: helix-turn-helix domain-containing protein [Patescibacteria group bacterium]|nr:helix-turn-helix domain-containing protein [Patescibacteria group bacterium]